MNLKINFGTITNSQWWKEMSCTFHEQIKQYKNSGILILYNADADGFVSTHFLCRIYNKIARKQSRLFFKAVWNYEFKFEWLEEYLFDKSISLVICLDLPIIQEPEVLHSLTLSGKKFLIYDHHIVPQKYLPIEGVSYFNSRLLDNEKSNHPTSIISALLADHVVNLTYNEYLIAAIGLLGDQSLHLYPEYYSLLQEKSRDLFNSDNLWKSRFGKITSLINAFFRANPSKNPKDIHWVLLNLIQKEDDFINIIDSLNSKYGFEIAQKMVNDEVNYYINKLSNSYTEQINKEFICLVLPMRTFSVGIIATILAKRNIAPMVAIGFNADNTIQFEIRRADSEKRSIIDILNIQKKYFTPLTAGGHPMAAGALVKKGDENKFCISFTKAMRETLKG